MPRIELQRAGAGGCVAGERVRLRSMSGSSSSGVCTACGRTVAKGAMARHLGACLPQHSDPKGQPARLIRLRVEGAELPMFWLDVEVKENAPLAALDQLLRDLWLECCGHLSAFRIGRTTYTQLFDDGLGDEDERSLATPVKKALRGLKGWLKYEYDFGSTTYLRMRVAGTREGIVGRRLAHLRARNVEPLWKCDKCKQPATLVCSYCVHSEYAFLCEKHAKRHECGEEAMLPVVNSPRVGVCGYTGEIPG